MARVRTRVTYPQRAAARRRASAPKKRKTPQRAGADWTKWAIVGSAAVLAFFVFRAKESEAATLRVPLPTAPPPSPEPAGVVGQARFIRVGASGQPLKCFDQVNSGFVQDLFCDQQKTASVDDDFFFPPELKG